MVTVHPFETEEEALAIANGTEYGLAGSVWTGDAERGRRFAEQMDTGMVWVNTWLHRDLRVPFGGVKHSGVGREGGEWSLGFFSKPSTSAWRTTPERRGGLKSEPTHDGPGSRHVRSRRGPQGHDPHPSGNEARR